MLDHVPMPEVHHLKQPKTVPKMVVGLAVPQLPPLPLPPLRLRQIMLCIPHLRHQAYWVLTTHNIPNLLPIPCRSMLH